MIRDPEATDQRVAVCIPTLGRDQLWTRSLPSALEQLRPDDEIIVVFHDLDPTRPSDEPLDLLDRRVKLSRFDGGSVSSVRNFAVGQAKANLLLFLDDDDRLLSGAVESMRERFDSSAVLAVSGAVLRRSGRRDPKPGTRGAVLDDSRSTVESPKPLGAFYSNVTANFLAGSFMVRRSTFDEVGGYSEELHYGENYDLGVRICSLVRAGAGRIEAFDQPVCEITTSASSYGQQRCDSARFTLATYRELLADLPAERAELWSIIGVDEWRLKQRGRSRAAFFEALKATPRDATVWARLMFSLVYPLAQRRWGSGSHR